MTLDELQRSIKYRIVPASVNADGSTTPVRVYNLPQDIIDNTVKAFSVNVLGYTAGAPTGRYFAPANGPDCIQVIRGDCAPTDVQVGGAALLAVRFRRAKAHRPGQENEFHPGSGRPESLQRDQLQSGGAPGESRQPRRVPGDQLVRGREQPGRSGEPRRTDRASVQLVRRGRRHRESFPHDGRWNVLTQLYSEKIAPELGLEEDVRRGVRAGNRRRGSITRAPGRASASAGERDSRRGQVRQRLAGRDGNHRRPALIRRDVEESPVGRPG